MTSARTDAESVALWRRVVELERSNALERDRAELLVTLQRALAEIARMREPSEIVAALLRAVYDPLGFERVVLIESTRESGIHVRTLLDRSSALQDPPPGFELAIDGDAILAAIRDERQDEIGSAADLCAPFVDGRGWYVVAAFPPSGAGRTIIYCDGHRLPAPSPWHAELVRTMTTIVGIVYGNAGALESTREAATRDPLTGLHNRRALMDRLATELDVARASRDPLTYVLIDVDDFKRINDGAGHAAGDRALQRLADVLRDGARNADIAARFAGDEFVLVLPRTTPREAEHRVERLLHELRAIGIPCSIGAATTFGDESAEQLFERVDAALYATKHRGKNGYTIAS